MKKTTNRSAGNIAKITKLFPLFLVLLVIPIAVFMALQKQEIRQHAAGTNCNNTGVTKNSDGSYSFAWLHVDTQGNVMDSNNCIIHLIGVNQGGLFLGNANGTTDINMLQARMSFFHTTLPSNSIRVNYNSYWWTSNVYVPDARMHFRDWLKLYIKMQEQAGNYVILDTGTQFHNPPCGNDPTANPPVHITACPSQNQAQKNIPPDPTEMIYYQPTALQGLTDLATLYKDDPAIIFDVWNEPTTNAIDELTYMADMKQRIQTVRTIATKSLIMVWERDMQQANYGDSNIMWSFHSYSPTFTGAQFFPNVQYAHSHGQAVIISEFGGATPSEAAIAEMTSLAVQNNVNLTYFESGNLFTVTNKTPPPYTLNTNGQLVHKYYSTIFANSTPTQGISQTPIPSITITPTLPAHISPTPTPSTGSGSPTPTPGNKNGISFFLTLCPHGLGNCGDNVSSLSGGTTNPGHPTRNISLSLTDTSNTPVSGSPFLGQVTYVSSSQNFHGTVTLPNLPNGQYVLTVKMEGYLSKQIPGIVAVIKGQQVTLPAVSLITGDIGPVPGINNTAYGDNQIDITDYNVLISCYGSKYTTASCLNPAVQQSPGADITDDGQVDGADINEFLRELSVQKGG